MNSKKEVQHVYLVGAKSLGAYGGYETFVYKLTEYHQNKENIKYHVACKANGDGCMDESKFDGVTKINEHEFELHNLLKNIFRDEERTIYVFRIRPHWCQTKITCQTPGTKKRKKCQTPGTKL